MGFRDWEKSLPPPSEELGLTRSSIKLAHGGTLSSLSERYGSIHFLLGINTNTSRAIDLSSIFPHPSRPGFGKTKWPAMSSVGKSTNIFWQECPLGKHDREKLLKQRGCVVWITGLSGSGKSTLACTLGRELHTRGKLSYILDGDNLRHGLNKDLGFKAEDRAENIRRVGEVAKLFADAGLICIASLISPYRRDRDTCRALLPDASFIEVYMNMPLDVCEARDPKGLYKLARAGKIKGFTGIDDPYEPPLNCEIEIQQQDGICPSPCVMAGQVVTYLEEKGFLHA
ncbi:hypothetical protein J5N97_027426 [Dioscorea zingiberensis]|uniref:Adenylyl-sulfate kinase n=1 Tax=Dioscorea zingiberensis TaxID=325984 RepID=A0A9D5H7N3_9LILI|nr:hypothetical protein J5N97_027426 [Dioscorea zingiberensis]